MKNILWLYEEACRNISAEMRARRMARIINRGNLFHIFAKASSDVGESDFIGMDIIVMQRLNDVDELKAVEKWGKGIPTIYDIDDAFWLLPDSPGSPDFVKYGCAFPPFRKNNVLYAMHKLSKLVVCTTNYFAGQLQEMGLKTQVIRNCPDPLLFGNGKDRKLGKFDSNYHIGWYGASGHDGNLELVCGVMDKVIDWNGISCHIVGDLRNRDIVKNLVKKHPDTMFVHAWVPYDALSLMIGQFDMVICPVIHTPFYHCKSEIKAVESIMSGCAVVASDTPAYREMRDLVGGIPELVSDNTVKEWTKTIEEVILEDSLMKTSDVNTMYEKVTQVYNFLEYTNAWVTVFHKILS